MKYGQISSKELSDFIRERATIEETYARSMAKLAKTASNYSQLGTFAPVWEVFKTSTEKLASCHLELVRKLQELIKDAQKYSDEQIKTHKKTKEEVSSTLESVQNIQSITQALQKSKENYNVKSVEQERLKKEGATQKEIEKAGIKTKKATETYKAFVEKYASAKIDFEQKMTETAQKFQDIEEAHVLQMKEIIQCYSVAIEETHLQISQVHNEFVNNMENTTVENLIQKFAETKGTGKERPGPIEFEECNTANAVEADLVAPKENSSLSSSPNPSPWGAVDEVFSGSCPGVGPRSPSTEQHDCPDLNTISKPPSESVDFLSSVCWSQSQWISFNDEMISCKHLKTLKERQRLQSKHNINVPSPTAFSSTKFFSDDPSDLNNPTCNSKLFVEENVSRSSQTSTPALNHIHDVTQPARPTTPLASGGIVPPPRPSSRPKLSAGKLCGINEIARPFSPPKISNSSPPPSAPLARAESTSSISSAASLSAANTPTIGISRGPSPVSLGSQDSLPVAAAFTESVNAYFKGADPTKCIVKITGDMTLSFPSGVIKIFTNNPSPAVLSFRLKNTSKIEQILPNPQLLSSDLSQSDSNTKDFWMNMQALTAYLRKMSEQNPTASYYNVDILKYQVSSNGIQSTPLNLATYWKCSQSSTDVRVDYKYNPESMVTPAVLNNVQVLVPVDGGVSNMQSLPAAIWNADQKKALWKLSDISEKSDNGGSGSLRAKFDITEGPSNPSTLAVQFLSEGSTLSGLDIELVGTGYRLSLTKKRFATGARITNATPLKRQLNPHATNLQIENLEVLAWQFSRLQVAVSEGRRCAYSPGEGSIFTITIPSISMDSVCHFNDFYEPPPAYEKNDLDQITSIS
ncbi:FCHO2 protein, partial [Polypterus senegalus]|nr:FCHO2 protein [Polypterus senegalus]